ncbi:peptidoglycan DD-metalloendopeptidase family protein [Campylobacter sp. LH-2024]|uniref:M23 family metallopeptidase n=1 Tax=Campylobacter molothri TaxID=1032242 RepID=A0ACC5W2M4_9BACT|nr:MULTISPECIES: M23 family metallopeptidase [unclassified Campylobacter]MBZ7928686.1 M23 family metallopeptidase [Campylobacter sp. RM10542]MBZ7930175.1 M23 family metallopeptidase [Campylobacter sp. W0067]MBZ7931652.1 M23 family metallopeptidase [Campylobacter sp. RM12910]MBZ7933055.1 M23 family metallopeptidase [Campylobacter sp. RM10543]MBZ7937652.1 M23 family metallopeptidase [Campylobacter sp. RM10538]MBZ7940528.1 M23 family metallopeptidase [Campylobacter sp. W0047]MBZ7943235.1 M23 fa
MIKNKFTITITDVNGSKHFYLNQIIKKIFIYIIAFVLLFLIFSGFYIKYLDSKVTDVSKKREELLKKSKELEYSNIQMQKKIEEKAKQYAAIEDKIASFEEALGLEAENNLTITDRLENLKLTNEQQIEILRQIPNGWPIENKGITGNFGWREHPLLKRKEFHPGIDLRAEVGTPVYATANGVVEFAGYSDNGYGYNVILLHNFGFKTVFAHMTRRDVVKAGQFVTKGQLIGYSGNTGLSTGPHLHYEVRFINKTLEPLYFLNLKRKNMNNFFNQERRVPWQSLVKAVTAQHLPQTQKQQ